MSTRRRGSSPMVRGGAGLGGSVLGNAGEGMPEGARYTRRRQAVSTSDYKNCALVQTRFKLGEISMS